MNSEQKTISYKDTINLPKTSFSMKAQLTMKEPEIEKYWQSMDIYGTLRLKRKGKKKFILHDGPPYANGHIHIGHALNKILKDFVIKFHSLLGEDCPYVPGWDCHGLPIEHQVLKDHGEGLGNSDVLALRKKCREFAAKFVDIQREEFKRLGIFGQWDAPYLTMDYDYQASIVRCFRKLAERGFITKKLRPIHWSPACQTALAEAELEYKEHVSPSIYVKFPCVDAELEGKKVFLLIWTTTPWTLLANRAVAANPHFEYAYVDAGNEVWVMAADLVGPVGEKGKKETFRIIKKVPGSELEALQYRQIFHAGDLPVIMGEHVSKEDGTGLVHTAPGHGYDDYIVGLKYDLPVFCPVDTRGCFTDEVEDATLVGMNVFDANKKIIEKLRDSDVLYFNENIKHSYPYCWRSKTPVIFRATEQWFIDLEVNEMRRKALDIIRDSVRWIPSWGENRIREMVAGRPDWCISRQRNWGVPIPVFYCNGCGETILDPNLIKGVEALVSAQGADVWFSRPASDLIPKDYECPKCQAKEFRKEKDILDVWFDSGISHTAVIRKNKDFEYPADLYLEGSDQHRGWFQSALLTAIGIDDSSPFKSVLTHGFVVDGEGNKMSKSVGNVIKPQAIIKKYGADILRLWVASSDYTDDIRLSEDILKQVVDAYRKMRNTLRYLLGNLFDFNPVQHNVLFVDALEIDKWALIRLKGLVKRVKVQYENCQFFKVYPEIHNFCVIQMSNFYLDVLKDRLYVSHRDSQARRSGQTALYRIAETLSKILSPILSFTCEEFWGFMNKTKGQDKSIHLEEWPDLDDIPEDEALMKEWGSIIKFRDSVLKEIEELRSRKLLGTSLEAKVSIRCAGELFDILNKHRDILFSIFIVSQVCLEKGEEEKIVVSHAAGQKCQRCWNYSESVGQNNEHSTICERCVAAIKGG